MKFKAEAIGISLVLAITLVTGVAAAEDEQSGAVLDEVVVTAQRREEAAHDVPISITTLSADLLEATGATQMRDIAQLTPALRFDSNSAFTQPTIRGVGTSVVSSGSTSNVGLYVDGFYIPNPLGVDFQLNRPGYSGDC